jgi:hypothetical protein
VLRDVVCEIGGDPIEVGGAVWTLLAGAGGGTRGTLVGGIEGFEFVVVGDVPVTEALGAGTTRPGGAGSFVAELADPGRTTGRESLMLGFLTSAKALYENS